MSQVMSSLVLAFAFALVSLAPAAAFAAGGSMEEVLDCVLKSLPPSVHGKFVLTHTHADGKAQVINGEYWSESPEDSGRRVVVASTGGPAEARAAYLFREGDTIGQAWRWTPKMTTAQRIESKGSDDELFGTDVTLEDFARFARINFPGKLRRLDDAEIGGRSVFMVETTPAPDAGSDYSKLISAIDKGWCVVVRRESFETAFEGGAKPNKVMTVDAKDVKVDQGFARVTSALLSDMRDGSTTRAQLQDLSLDAKLPADFFTPEKLAQAVK
ncbi:MAG: outer membrane lipoprotein-sorting protein [bacterium]